MVTIFLSFSLNADGQVFRGIKSLSLDFIQGLYIGFQKVKDEFREWGNETAFEGLDTWLIFGCLSFAENYLHLCRTRVAFFIFYFLNKFTEVMLWMVC